MAWMTAEAAVAITAGVAAGSIALVGFGLDSVIEFAAAGIVVWQLIADSAETAFCAFTSAATLLGTGLNAWLGWWQSDPAAALVIAALAAREGLETWEDHDDDQADEGSRAPDHG